jgi:hypothetical protein
MEALVHLFQNRGMTRCYNMSHPGLKLTAYLRLDECKPLLVCFKSLPDFRKYCLHIIQFYPSVLLDSCLSCGGFASASKYPTWCHSLLSSCHYDRTHDFVYPSCSIYLKECISDRAEDHFSLAVLTPMEDVGPTMQLEKALFDPKHSTMNTSRVMRNRHSLQGALLPTHRRKDCMGEQEVFLRSTVLISPFLHAQYIHHHSLEIPLLS